MLTWFQQSWLRGNWEARLLRSLAKSVACLVYWMRMSLSFNSCIYSIALLYMKVAYSVLILWICLDGVHSSWWIFSKQHNKCNDWPNWNYAHIDCACESDQRLINAYRMRAAIEPKFGDLRSLFTPKSPTSINLTHQASRFSSPIGPHSIPPTHTATFHSRNGIAISSFLMKI